jgi:hypothetical protein
MCSSDQYQSEVESRAKSALAPSNLSVEAVRILGAPDVRVGLISG